MNIFTQLKNTNNLTNNEKQIVDLILENPSKFLDMNSEQFLKNVLFPQLPYIVFAKN